MIEAVDRIERYMQDISHESFLRDSLRQDAVVRCLEIIGEAARHIPDEERRKLPDVPWEAVVGTRNLLAHGYFVVDPEVVWVTATRDLPPLRVALKNHLSSEEDEA